MTKLPPEHDISPFYQVVGVLGLLLSAGLAVLILKDGQVVTKWAVALAALPFVLALLLVRPKLLDALVRVVMRKLPWTKYQGNDPGADQ